MTNAGIAAALEELAVLYELDGADRYRVLAYVNSARTIRREGRSVEELARSGRVTELPGIGKTLEEKILALLATGEIPAAATLRERVPPGLVEINRIPGLGPKTIRQLHVELGIETPADLQAAAEAGKVRELKGFGARSEANILAGLERLEAEPQGPQRLRLDEILPVAEALVQALREHPACDRAGIAGSIRRRTETCGDIDLVAASTSPLELTTAIAAHRTVASHGTAGEEGVKLTTHAGVDVDVRVVRPDAYGNLLQHLTGSAPHNARLRERAAARGLHVSEHGVKDDATGVIDRFETEAEVYRRLGYDLIEPELREDRGELVAAAEGSLPELVETGDIRGELHCHTTLSDGTATLEEMAAAARERGYEYLAITDHSASHGFGDHVSADRLWRRIEEIETFNDGDHGIRLLAGSEVNILPDGSLDYPDDLLGALDWVIASIHTAFHRPADAMTARLLAAIEHPEVDCIAHATGRLINRRDPCELNLERCFTAAARCGTAFEINGNPARRDLDETAARLAAEAGVEIALNTDAHRPEHLDFMFYAVATARRAWLGPAQILNAKPWRKR